jgi:ABC-type multidrug transport system ATPase subunit
MPGPWAAHRRRAGPPLACSAPARLLTRRRVARSTLLDALAGRLSSGAAMTGRVLVNGHEAHLSYGRSAYVTQDEVLIGTLTVRETITYAARLRLRGGPDAPSPAQVADGIVADLGLTEAADTVIGNWHMRGVSGGQRRRVVIGCELVIQPTLLFLDEPTSGLDAAAAYHVTSVIKRLCASGGACAAGRTVLCVIHQPASEVFEQFDTLALLAAGATVYFGPAQTAADFFSASGLPAPRNRSASDHLLHAVNADFGDAHDVAERVARLTAAYEASPIRADIESRIAAVDAKPGPRFESGQAPPAAWRQMLVLTERSFTNNWRDIGIFWMRLAMVRFGCGSAAAM